MRSESGPIHNCEAPQLNPYTPVTQPTCTMPSPWPCRYRGNSTHSSVSATLSATPAWHSAENVGWPNDT